MLNSTNNERPERPLRPFLTTIGWLLLVLFAVTSFVVLLMATAHFNAIDPELRDAPKLDVYYTYLEGQRIIHGENPYERILSGDMRTNDKYPTYLPGFYLIAAALQAIGRDQFHEFHALLRNLAVPAQLLAATLLLAAFLRRRQYALGFLVAWLFLFNRFNFFVIEVVHLENFILPFLVLAFLLYRRFPRWACLAFGVTLALKQIGIFLIPLFLIDAWLRPGGGPRDRVFHTLRHGLWLAALPAAVSLPFLFWNARAFLLSVLFSVTREPSTHLFATRSLDAVLFLHGTTARLPMLALMAACYVAHARGRITLPLAATLVMAIFIGFNPVLFYQYFVWLAAPLAVVVLENTASTGNKRSPLAVSPRMD